jgi:PKD repeat protein
MKSGSGDDAQAPINTRQGQSQEDSSLMNVFPHIRSLGSSRSLRNALIPLLLALPAVLPAQEVSYTAPGIISLGAALPVYNDKYAIKKTDFGFLWLDTTSLQPGLVQVEAKCGTGQPPSATGIYVIGDCNGISNVSTSGTLAVGRQFSGQCGAAVQGCNGGRVNGTGLFFFKLGTWEFLGSALADIPDSTQTTDLQGRTWNVQALDTGGRNFKWVATGSLTAPPTALATATNQSAGVRADKAAYYGDKWQLVDASTPTGSITRIDWDFVYNGVAFAADETGDPATEGTVTGYFPCDPSGPVAGNIRSSANCIQSLGLTNPATSNSYRFAMQSANVNGTSATPFISSPVQVSCPQANVTGYTGFTGTCAKSGGTLNVLTGGSADASGSLGNLTEASFEWSFVGSTLTCSTITCGVPVGATSFTLAITYPGGYQATATGNIVVSNLVAAFSIAPNPVLLNAQLTLTNQMQKAATTTLDAVDYLINPGACGTPPPIATNPVGGTFLTGGTATVPSNAPANGTYCAYLKYSFTPQGQSQQTQIVSNAFAATDWQATPQIQISPLPICGSSLCAQIGTQYSLSDAEIFPVGLTHPAAQWDLSGTPIGTSADAAVPIVWTPSSSCTSCTLRVTVNGAIQTLPVSVSSAVPTPPPTPLPTPTGGGSLSVSVSGPGSGSRGVTMSYTASASGGSPPYSYQWQCDYNPLGGFSSGQQTQTCSWSTSGTHNVKALIRDASGQSALSPDFNVNITGIPGPSSSNTVTGPNLTLNPFNGRYSSSNGSPITFTANENNAASYSWNFGDGTSAATKSFTKTYTAGGSYAIALTVAGDGVNTSGTASATINLDITGPPRPSTAYTVTGATQTGADAYTAEAGRTITFAATATLASGFSWDFGDETKTGRSVTKNYSAAAARTVRLTVTGDGTNTAGTASVNIAMNITPPSFRATIVPGVAHLDDGTTTWGSDVSITNSGTASMNVGLAFVPFAGDAPASLDLTQLGYSGPVALTPGGSFSMTDVVAALNGGNNKGTLVVQYKGGTQAPLVSARVYFQPKVNPGNLSYGSGLPAYEVDGTGNITPQGFTSIALSKSPQGLQTESETETLDVSLAVALTGSGSGIITSDPAGISCPATCSFSFPIGTSVQLTGSAAAGSNFAGITGCDSYVLGQCSMSMFSSRTVTAQFDSSGPAPTPTPTPAPGNVTLSVTRAGTGTGTVSSAPSGISCGATCSAQFAQGTSVTLSATPDSGVTFSGWSGACSGTGSCAVTLSAATSVTATFTSAATPPSLPQGDQVLIGLRSDPRYRFVVTLFNAGGSSGDFELKATDDQGVQVLILDATGSRVASRNFSGLGPYQQVYLKDSDLGLDNGKHYVLKANATKGTLLAFGTALDRKTNDLVQISDDSQASPAEQGIVSYWVAGVSRLDSSAHWRTDLRIFNRGSKARKIYFEYSYTSDGATEHVAHVNEIPIASGEQLTYDDVVGSLLSSDKTVDLSGNSAGILRVYYAQDDESATRPIMIGSRNYNDQPTGTAGTQLAVYTLAQAAGAGQKLYLSGAEDSDRYGSRIGVFSVDAGPVTGRIVAVASDGSEVGSVNFTVGGSSPHYGQLSLTDPNMNFTNPGKPVSIRIDQLSGGRVGAYAFTVDKVTLDTNFIQALPQD